MILDRPENWRTDAIKTNRGIAIKMSFVVLVNVVEKIIYILSGPMKIR
jgi:hypothetical protein